MAKVVASGAFALPGTRRRTDGPDYFRVAMI